MYIYVLLSSLVFAFIAWRNLNLALTVLFALLPMYLIRFNIGPLPSTLLEVMIWIVLAVWLTQGVRDKKYLSLITYHLSLNKLLSIGIALFLLGATISIFTSLDIRSALGEWKAFYVEPILLFLVLATTLRVNPPPARLDSAKRVKGGLGGVNAILFALILSGLLTSILAIYQHFTGFAVPSAFWENGNSYRATAWYGFPNAVGLFLAPLIPLALYLFINKVQDTRTQGTNKSQISNLKIKWFKNWNFSIGTYLYLVSCILFLVVSPIAIFYAKSTGGIIGVLAGIFVLLLVYKKTRWPTLIVCLLGFLGFLSLSSSSPIKQELLFQDRSGQIRVAIYKETLQLLKDRPILGAGLASYAKRIESYHTTVNGEGTEIFHHPHNILLTMWVNTGIIGLVGFVLILIWFYRAGLSMIKEQGSGIREGNKNCSLFIVHCSLASMSILLTSGLVDSPYIKNDLAVLFWLLPALMFISTKLPQSESP